MNKKCFILFLLALCTALSQKIWALGKLASPDGIIFQAIATDAQGNPAAGRMIYVQDAILQKTASGNVVYAESFRVVASTTGVFTIVIGKGVVLSGPASIGSIDWSAGTYFLNIKSALVPSIHGTDWKPAYVDMGTSQFWSVPYALHAASVDGINFPATNGVNGQVLTTNGMGKLSWTTPTCYSLPIAGATALGGVKVGESLSVDANGVLNVTKGVIGATGPQGPIGLTGATGPQGILGLPGIIDASKYLQLSGGTLNGNLNISKSPYLISGNIMIGHEANTATEIVYFAANNAGVWGYNNSFWKLYHSGTGNDAITFSTVDGSGTFTGDVKAPTFSTSSDKRLKINIIPVNQAMETIMKLNPVHYNKKSTLSSSDYNMEENGFVAQEIRKVMPFIVSETLDKDKLLSVNYTSIIPLLTKGIQEQEKLIKIQQTKIDKQQKEIDDLKSIFNQLVNFKHQKKRKKSGHY